MLCFLWLSLLIASSLPSGVQSRADDDNCGHLCEDDESILLQTRMTKEGPDLYVKHGNSDEGSHAPSVEDGKDAGTIGKVDGKEIDELEDEIVEIVEVNTPLDSEVLFQKEVDVQKASKDATAVPLLQEVTVPNYVPPSLEILQAASNLRTLQNIEHNIYSGINSKIDPKFVRQIRDQTPAIIHELRVKAGLKGPLHYPHMHIANRAPVSNDKVVTPPQSSAFDLAQSALKDDHVLLTLVCFVLIAFSSFANLRGKGNKGNGMSSDIHHALDDVASASELLSVWDGTVQTFSSIVGMGLLCLPYAMSCAGWVGVPLIVFFTGCAGYTAQLLTSAMQHEVQKAGDRGLKPLVLGWGFLLGAIYGPRAARSVNVFLIIELWGYMLSGTVAAAMNLTQLVHGLSSSSAICLTVLVQFLLTTVSMKTLARLNVACNGLFMVCCAMFIVTGLRLPSKAEASELKFVRLDGILAACGIIVFSPAAHSLYPAIMQRMEQPEKYPVCLRNAYLLACVVYVSFAVPGYYLFGNASQSSAVRNIGVDRNLVPLPNLGWMNYAAAFCMLLKLSGLQPLILTNLTSTIEGMLDSWVPRLFLSMLTAPIVLTISAVVAMHFASQIASLLNLVGSIFCMSIAFVLPVLCYWRINKQNVGSLHKVAFVGLIVMGSSFAILGLINALDT